MSREYIVGGDFTTKQGIERRVDVTPDWQVWVDDDKRMENLEPLSGVMVSSYIANVDNIVTSAGLYKSGIIEYKRLVEGSDAETIDVLSQHNQKRVGTVFGPSLRKLYEAKTSVLRNNILPIRSIAPLMYLLLSSDMSDSDHILSIVKRSVLLEQVNNNNEKLEYKTIKYLQNYRFIAIDRKGVEENLTPNETKVKSFDTLKKQQNKGESSTYYDSLVNKTSTVLTESEDLAKTITELQNAAKNPTVKSFTKAVLAIPADQILSFQQLTRPFRENSYETRTNSGIYEALYTLINYGYFEELEDRGVYRRTSAQPRTIR